MLKHVIFTSQESACNRPAWSNWAVISITDSGTNDAPLQIGWQQILRLSFDDIDHGDGEYLLFDVHHAQSILEFVQLCNDEKAEGILVHCRQGISRSAAVAKWICQNRGLSFPADYDQFNKHIYTVLREEYLLKSTEPNYCLEDLLAQCDVNAPVSEEVKAWEGVGTVGKEIF